ncbi:hypothetical protein [Pseudomonas luteola]|uniref:Uncharacterized protein n=1 Tax=Pseudomonas luteola TaxID=47886 RepID=A0A2X2CEY9_PSELU|nr:hypothetical protein [Pseudomonas luteola]MCG7374212.1 hypothetical protein [Pseudomonas luteola]SPZ05311.1 Uncharacterised protein [Pseudomonas luteola]
MSVGKVTQSISLTTLPPGAKFSITSIDTPQNETFYTHFSGKNVPYDVGCPGNIGESIIQTNDITGSGIPPYVTLEYRISSNDKVSTGRLRFTTTEFSATSRPDYSNLLFDIDGEPPQLISQEISMLVAPQGIFLGFTMVDNKFVIAASPENNITLDVLNGLISGVLEAHKYAIKWIIP